MVFRLDFHANVASDMWNLGCQSFRHSAISTQCHFDTEETLRHRNTPKSESFRHSFGRFDTLSHKCIFVFIYGVSLHGLCLS